MDRFICCICGAHNREVTVQHRERAFCTRCGSNARFRGLMLAIMRYVFRDQRPLATHPQRPDIKAIGVSDTDIYAKILAEKISYTNTFYHTEPRLDLCDVESVAQYSNLDIIVCSDVIEHTIARPYRVLRNIFTMLKPGGVAVISAPTFALQDNIEWYPRARTLAVLNIADRFEVHWRDVNGSNRMNQNPCFHGGPGSTLEMRLISHNALLQDATEEGFEVETLEFEPAAGYWWTMRPEYPGIDAVSDGRVIVCRKPDGP